LLCTTWLRAAHRAAESARLAPARESGHKKLVTTSIPIRPAATVIVLRDMPSGLEVLLVQRAGELAFHGGAWVFPGGRVERDDRAEGHALSAARAAELSAARTAGVRETREEAGLVLAADALLPFSHWTTPEGRPRRFSTWFFLAEIEPHFDVVVDGGEILAHRWLTPEAALVLRAQGEIDLPPPTFVSLTVLTGCVRVADALSRARAHEPPVFVPRPRDLADGVVSLFPGDAAYEGGELSLPGARHRLWMLSSGYRYERG
jgi:8-oxo-dGTP pyrophosphatase MutT (NUDIX family)